jgi:hypothetical protein
MYQKILSIIILAALSCLLYVEAKAQNLPLQDGSFWQQTIRITGLIEPYNYFEQFLEPELVFNEDGDLVVNEEEAAAMLRHYRSITGKFWHSLRDTVDVALRDGRLNAYSIKSSGRTGQERIFIKDEQLEYTNLISSLNRSLERVASLRQGDVLYIVNRDDVLDARNFVSDFNNYFERLNAINQFEIELILRYNESGFNIIPTQLIFGVAMYPSRFIYEENKMSFFTEYENGLGFMIDLTDSQTIEFLTRTGMQVSGDHNVFPYYDLFMKLNYDYVFYSISGRELAISADEPFLHELERVRLGVMNNIHTIMFEQVYGQVPDYWIRGGRGPIINGLD